MLRHHVIKLIVLSATVLLPLGPCSSTSNSSPSPISQRRFGFRRILANPTAEKLLAQCIAAVSQLPAVLVYLVRFYEINIPLQIAHIMKNKLAEAIRKDLFT